MILACHGRTTPARCAGRRMRPPCQTRNRPIRCRKSRDSPLPGSRRPLREFADWAIKDGLHPECAAAAGLAALVTLTGPARLKLSDAKTIKAILWTALLGVASSGKSPAYEHAFSLVRAAYVEKREEYRARRPIWRESPGNRRQEGGRAARPVRPEPYELDDATTEAVARWLIARSEDSSGSVVDDELAAFLEGLDQYKGGHGSDLSKWLKLWTGAPLHIQRVAGWRPGEPGVACTFPSLSCSVTGPLVPGQPAPARQARLAVSGPGWLPFYAPAAAPEWNQAVPVPGGVDRNVSRVLSRTGRRGNGRLRAAARARWEIARPAVA